MPLFHEIQGCPEIFKKFDVSRFRGLGQLNESPLEIVQHFFNQGRPWKRVQLFLDHPRGDLGRGFRNGLLGQFRITGPHHVVEFGLELCIRDVWWNGQGKRVSSHATPVNGVQPESLDIDA